jgi:hypothetical protein
VKGEKMEEKRIRKDNIKVDMKEYERKKEG